MLIPIGSWCRTAYQVRVFLEKNDIKSSSYPFDWTITPFSALQNTLKKGFTPDQVLQHEDLALSKFGSIADRKTNLIHHHDFPPKTISSYGNGKLRKIPSELFASDLIEKAQGRFIHTYENLLKLRNCNGKIGFVRWHRTGHPDPKLPDAFEGENLATLTALLSNFLEHDNFSILLIKTVIVQNELSENDIIVSYLPDSLGGGVSAIIKERKGFDGDGTNNFKGDTVSWHHILTQYINEENINLG
ncbi:DUF1796 family putative cysteine peptidase [Nitrosomonas sp. Is37]|uniref:DUF1796 family putative cysteine peptidase n=1 Tax=Nitrosomonas sp. Is37 TaxID=3080535 RepID=UPI00294B0488|nr:DUF1796 family putative cysteine peptidase [Nitrosomonas sp. Is37]MDV6344306.1 DUF1796 family putative cysteine peptidase [Nitrosomonas sp. Is37]